MCDREEPRVPRPARPRALWGSGRGPAPDAQREERREQHELEAEAAALRRLAVPPGGRAAGVVAVDEASRSALEAVHDPSYLDLLDTVTTAGGARLDPDTYCAPASYGIARRAVGGLLAHERAERVRAALDSLAEPRRVVIYLHRFEELGFAEIGRVLGISEGAAKLRAFRAYGQLRSALADLVTKDPS